MVYSIKQSLEEAVREIKNLKNLWIGYDESTSPGAIVIALQTPYTHFDEPDGVYTLHDTQSAPGLQQSPPNKKIKK